MKEKYIIFISFMFIFITCITYSTAASTNPKIRIDKRLCQFDPPCQIVNDRTMVPVRFVIEDEAFHGQVYWDSNLRKVAFDCRGKYIEFFIGSKKAMVNGKTYYFDTAPYIYNDRTYVPLRFLAENLGAQVSWNNREREVSISFDYMPRVFAYYYYTSLDEFKENIHLFSDVAFRWFATNGRGELYYEYRDNYGDVLELARNNGIKTHASVVLMGKEALHDLLSSKDNRARLIGNLLDKVKMDNYDGVNIDFEFIDPGDAVLFTTFIQELKASLGPEKTLSVAVFARTGKENWPTAYQYKKIGQIADLVVVMAYDYSYKTSPPGPIAPLWWVEEVVDYMICNIDRDKILLGVPTYGYNWSVTGTTTVTAEKLDKIKKQYTVYDYFDVDSMSPYYTYLDTSNIYHQIWLENERSLNEKLNVVQENNLGGISFWRVGTGFEDLYNVLAASL